MFQVSFSEQSMRELNRLGVAEQMRLVELFGAITHEQLAHPREPLGRFSREGSTLYRLRAGDYRCYFDVNGEQLNLLYMLPRNSFTDFLVRSKLPMNDEILAENQPGFWKYLESLTRK